MGRAIAKALVAKKFKAKIIVTDRKRALAAGVIFDARFKTLPKADIVIIAVKPQDVPALAEQVAGKINPQAIVISIAVGLKVKRLEGLFKHNKVVRTMPNLGLAVGEGVAVWKASKSLKSQDSKIATQVLDAVAVNFEVRDENLIDATTAISGNGPAYFFFLADSLMKAAQNLGLSIPQSRLLVETTMRAASKLQGNLNYQELIKRVRSKKGTTDASLNYFQKKNVQKIIIEAAYAGFKRAKELSRG